MRIAGLEVMPFAAWGNQGLEDSVFLCRRGQSTVEDTTLDGMRALLIEGSYEHAGGIVKHRTWVSPTMQYSIIKREVELNGLIQRVESQLEQFPENTWFPKTVLLTEERNGKLTRKERVQISLAEFNKSIPEDVFTLASLGIPKGTSVQSRGDHMVWNGSRLIPDPAWAITKKREWQQEPLEPRSWPKIVLFLNAVLCAVLAAVLLARRWKRKSPS